VCRPKTFPHNAGLLFSGELAAGSSFDVPNELLRSWLRPTKTCPVFLESLAGSFLPYFTSLKEPEQTPSAHYAMSSMCPIHAYNLHSSSFEFPAPSCLPRTVSR